MANTKAVLIVGGSGFLGTHLALRLRETYRVFATHHAHRIEIPGVTFVPSVLENRNWVKRVVYTARPEVIIYVAGSNSVEKAERDPRMAEFIHTGGVATVANVSDILQPKFIYISNCYPFDGSRGNYHESDIVLPNSALGKAKLAGENFIKGKSLNYVILRASPLYGRGNGVNLSWLDRIRMNLDQSKKVELTQREIHSFGAVEVFAELVARITESGLRNKVVHYGGLTKMTPFDFGVAFAKRFGYDPSLIVPAAAARRERRDKARTPTYDTESDFSLNSSMAIESLKIQPLLLEQGFDLLEKKLVPRA